jgi:hypothetical protein
MNHPLAFTALVFSVQVGAVIAFVEWIKSHEMEGRER